MSIWKTSSKQLSVAGPTVLASTIPAGLFLFACYHFSARRGIPLKQLTDDPLALLQASTYTGIISTAALSLWCAAFTICLFGALLYYRIRRGEQAFFFINAAIITLFLALNDIFLFHESLARELLGWPVNFIYSLYLLLLIGFVFRFRDTIKHTGYLVFILAAGLFAGSGFIDISPLRGPDMMHFVEEGLKLLGISCWLGYFTLVNLRGIDLYIGRRHQQIMRTHGADLPYVSKERA